MKAIGSLLLAGGFLAGAYMTVAQVDRVDWVWYGLCAALMLGGMVALRIDLARTTAEGGAQHDEDLDVLQASLANLTAKIAAIGSDTGDQAQLAVHQRIDAELMDDINDFVDARESMIPRLGMKSYADVMSPFAGGERLLNRAWSASADGYVDEVRACVGDAHAEWVKAAQLLESARTARG